MNYKKLDFVAGMGILITGIFTIPINPWIWSACIVIGMWLSVGIFRSLYNKIYGNKHSYWHKQKKLWRNSS